jgi:hypothetical protein
MALQLPAATAEAPARGPRALSTKTPDTGLPLDYRLQLSMRRRRSERLKELAATAGWVTAALGLVMLGVSGLVALH